MKERGLDNLAFGYSIFLLHIMRDKNRMKLQRVSAQTEHRPLSRRYTRRGALCESNTLFVAQEIWVNVLKGTL